MNLRLEIDLFLDPKNNPENPTDSGTIFTRVQKQSLDACEKPNKCANIEQQNANTNYQPIVYVNFEGERPDEANAMMKLTNQTYTRSNRSGYTTKHQAIVSKVQKKLILTTTTKAKRK